MGPPAPLLIWKKRNDALQTHWYTRYGRWRGDIALSYAHSTRRCTTRTRHLTCKFFQCSDVFRFFSLWVETNHNLSEKIWIKLKLVAISLMSSPPISYNVSSLEVQQYFGYYPSLALAGTATALFGSVTCIIFAQILWLRNRNARYMFLVVITGMAEAGGYGALIFMILQSGNTSLYSGYVAMQCLIVLSPNILQAATYTTVGKISTIGKMDSKSKWLKPKMISWGFVLLDLACLIIQAVGISIWASEKSSGTPTVSVVKLGSWITVGGLGGQLISFGLFTVLAVWIQRHPENKYRSHRQHTLLFSGVYGVIILISIRNIFRFVEFTQSAITYPNEGGVAENQVLFYCLEALPILLAFVLFIVLSPTYLLPKTPLDEFISGSSKSLSVDVEKAEISQGLGEEFSNIDLAA